MYHGRPWGSQDRMLEDLKGLSLCQVSGGKFEEGGSLWIDGWERGDPRAEHLWNSCPKWWKTNSRLKLNWMMYVFFFFPKQGVHDHITGGTVFLFLPWPMIIKRSLVWTSMCREAVSYSTGELKAQLEGPGSYHEMDISSVTCSTPIIRSLLSLPLYVGGMEKCGDTKHRKPACACLSVHLVQTGEKVLVQFYLLCGV